MTPAQKIILLAYAVLVTVMILFPPFISYEPSVHIPVYSGYGLVFLPHHPFINGASESQFVSEIDFFKLLCQYIGATLVAGALTLSQRNQR
jgi:hypothetical protein